MARGRKGRYETHVQPFLNDISVWYAELTEEQIAKKLGVSQASFERYKKQYPELTEALSKGKDDLVGELKTALKKKAKGFFYTETKTTVREEGGKRTQVVESYKRYAIPDTGAIHLLLKNLDPEWRNDDAATLELKRNKAELERQKAEAENW